MPTKMGKNSKTKKPEKLGKGQVTPIQVAFIVHRYLIDNNFAQTFSVFRSEASALIAKSNMKEAPKSLLSLEDILNDYIRLKEQKVFVDQEKCRVEKLLQGMQEVMNEYRASNGASVSPSPEPMTLTPEAVSTFTNGTSTLVSATSSTKVQSAVPTFPSSSKRKASASDPEPSSCTKKSFMETPSYPSSGAGTRPLAKVINHCSVPESIQHSIGNSQVRPTSKNHILHGSPVQELPSIQDKLHSQFSSLKRESPSPETPPQQYASQTDDLADSPLGMSSLIEPTDPSLEVTPTNGPAHSSHGSDYGSNYSEYNTFLVGEHSYASPSKFCAKKFIIKEHIKSRLDFDDFGTIESSVECASGTSDSQTNGGKTGCLDMDDFLNLSILDTDVSLSYLVNFEIDAQVAAPFDQAALGGDANLISSSHDEIRDANMGIDGVFSDPLSSRVGILSQKDMNCKGDDDGLPSKLVTACPKANSPGKMKKGYSPGQENIPML